MAVMGYQTRCYTLGATQASGNTTISTRAKNPTYTEQW